MTKHNKKYMRGAVKRTIMCPHCSYLTKGSIKEAEAKFSLHMKNKHSIDSNTMESVYMGMKKVYDINSSKVADEAFFMDNLLKMLK